jgi:hypothetical protein
VAVGGNRGTPTEQRRPRVAAAVERALAGATEVKEYDERQSTG